MRRFFLLLLALALSACGDDPPGPPVKTVSLKTPSFTDVTEKSGIDFVHHNGAVGQRYLPETMGSGVAVFDFDNDGRLDLFFVQSDDWPGNASQSSPTMALYRNVGELTFEDVSEETGTKIQAYGMGVCAADYDGDSDLDLFITCLGPDLLLRNDDGVFRDVAEESGVAGTTWTDDNGQEVPRWSTSAAFLDYDLDGWLDLFVCHYVRWSEGTDVFTSMNGVDKSYTVPTAYDGQPSRLYRNRGDGTFEDVTHREGIAVQDAKALGIAIAHLDGDDVPDFVVANDTEPNNLFLSEGFPGYRDRAVELGIGFDPQGKARAGMGIDILEIAERPTIVIGNFSREPLSLYQRTRDGFYIDKAASALIADATRLTLTFGLLYADVNLDGFEDILVANGHIEPDIERFQRDVTYPQPPQLFLQDEAFKFRDVSAECGEAFTRPMVARGLATGDLDGDGDLDIILTANGDSPRVLRNDLDPSGGEPHHWIRIRLEQPGHNRHALGATLVLRDPKRSRAQMVRTGSSYLSQSDTAWTFGLGREGIVESLQVIWPDGEKETFHPPSVDREWVLCRGGDMR